MMQRSLVLFYLSVHSWGSLALCGRPAASERPRARESSSGQTQVRVFVKGRGVSFEEAACGVCAMVACRGAWRWLRSACVARVLQRVAAGELTERSYTLHSRLRQMHRISCYMCAKHPHPSLMVRTLSDLLQPCSYRRHVFPERHLRQGCTEADDRDARCGRKGCTACSPVPRGILSRRAGDRHAAAATAAATAASQAELGSRAASAASSSSSGQ